MKRSFAVVKLKEEIEAIIYLYANNLLNRNDDADLLMNFIEHDLGMLPPLNVKLYNWEPEDEK